MTNERELGWDDFIEDDGPDFTILPAGDYDFEVVGFERARHPGSEKLTPCHKAVMSIRISDGNEQTTIKHNLFLHTKTEGLICAFFVGVGMRKKGEKVRMDFQGSVGCRGRCQIGTRKWINDNGDEVVFNEIKKFYDPEEAEAAKPKFQAGKF